MMACGGVCVVAENEGNSEYIENGVNTLTYKVGDIEGAVRNINNIIDNRELLDKLRIGGLDTVSKRTLHVLKEDLFKLFE